MKISQARWIVSILLVVLAQTAPAMTGRYSARPGDAQKIRVDSPALALQVEQAGGRLLADYGGFAVLEVNSAATRDLAAQPGVDVLADQNQILLNAGAIDTSSEAVRALRPSKRASAGRQLHLVQFVGPVKAEWVAELESAGAQIVSYIPNNAYLVYANAAAVARMDAMAQAAVAVQWAGAYLDSDKIQPRAAAALAGKRALATDQFAVQLVDDADANPATLALIDALKLSPVKRMVRQLGYVNVIVRLPLSQIEVLAAQPDVVSIAPYIGPKKLDERQGQIVAGNLTGTQPSGPGYLAWLYTKGFTQTQFTASGFLVDVCDSGVDNGTNRPNHFGLYVNGDTGQASRVVYNRLEGTPNADSTIQGCDGHGNLNSHIIGGYNNRTGSPHTDSAGYRYGLGVCPFVKVGSSVIFDPGSFTYPDYSDMISRAYRDGARISSDSWGADTAGEYDVDAQEYDALVRDAQPTNSAVPNPGNQGMTIVFAAGNAGPSSSTVGSPGTAKNVITVGAAENVHSHNIAAGGNNAAGNDGCDTPDAEANSADDIASFSSRGPCSDQRKKPDIVAPGTHVTGGAPQQTRTMTGNGTGLACFEGTGVCALPGGGTTGNTNNFFPLGQQFWTTSSGTSHSTPGVAGGSALVYQYFLNLSLNAPSPALLKAYLMNSARYMTGTDAGDDLWSNDQGMGGMNLGIAFNGAARILRDQLTNDLFTASGQSRRFYGMVADAGQALRVTLGWTDAPGATTGNAYKNNLDLVVTVNGVAYKGNVFSGAYSAAGGTADARNNVESVFLPAGTTGLVLMTVSAVNINSDGVPGYGAALDQDFALVAANANVFTPSNYPPVLDPIGNRAIATNRLMQFNVTASDPIDGDVVRLWAEGVPAWATFPGATNAATATSQFSGTAYETNRYTVTFYAGDKDGTNSETITVWVNDINCEPTNIIDEGFAGGVTPPAGWTFTGIAGTYTTAGNFGRESPSLKFDTTGDRVETPALNMPTNLAFWIKGQGTDSSSALLVEGYNGSTWATIVSVVPILTTSSTQSMALADGFSQLRFTYTKSAGNLAFDDVIIGGCGGTVPVTNRNPTISVAGGTNQAATVNELLSFVVTVNDADAEPVGLFTNAAPAGASFPGASGTAPIQSTFTWTPTTTGVFAAEFVAFDAKVTVTQGVRIVVSQPLPPLLPPVIQAASEVQGTRFNANWLAAEGALGYRLDVATNADFSSGGGGGGFTNLYENFSLFVRSNSSTDISASLDTYMHTPGWTGTKIYENIGTAKLGSSSAKGLITTPTVDLSAQGGAATLQFDLGKYGTDAAALVQVMHAADGATFVQVGADITPPATMTPQTLEITGGTAASKIRLQAKNTSNCRFYLDNFLITQAASGKRYVPGYQNVDVGDVTTYAVTGLVENLTYYYRARAYNASLTSSNSAVTNVVTTAATNQPPHFTAPASTNQAGVVSNLVSFMVTATAPDGDAVSLWAEGVPLLWAGFANTTSNGTVGSLFYGTPPEAQTNVVTFFAGDKDGTNSLTVRIAVRGVAGSDELLPPVIQAATGVQTNQFHANWLAAANATGYRLDVATNEAFRSGAVGKRAAALNPGDLMIVTVNADAPKGFDAVPLVDLDAGTEIFFTDNGWSNGNWRSTTEGVITYTAPGAITAGTVLAYRSSNENGFVKSGNFDPSGSGDNLLVYQGSAEIPLFIYGIGWASATPWVTNHGAVNNNNSEIPPALSVAAFTISAPGSMDDYQYLASAGTSGAKGDLLQWVANKVNWSGSDTVPFAKFTPDFTVGGGGAANDFVPGYQGRDVGDVTTYGVTGLVANSMYYYRVRAYNAVSNSANSAVTSVVTSASAGPNYRDWATTRGLDPDAPNGQPGANADSDADSNYEEYVADTNPMDSNSCFPYFVTNFPGTGVITIWAGPPTTNSRIYDVWVATNLLPPQAWTGFNFDRRGADDGSAVGFSVTNTGAGRFYRTGVKVPDSARRLRPAGW